MNSTITNTHNFLKTLTFTTAQKEEFFKLHEFILDLQFNLIRYNTFFQHLPFQLNLAGGCIRDLLLKGVDSIKDYDIIICIGNEIFHNHPADTTIENSFLKDPSIQKELLKINNNFLEEHIHVKIEILQKFLQEKYNVGFFEPSLYARHLITEFLSTRYTLNLKYNGQNDIDELNTEQQTGKYEGINENSLTGVIKTEIFDKPVDFLFVTRDNYVNDCFDFHICQASFPQRELIKIYPKYANDDLSYSATHNQSIYDYKKNKINEYKKYIDNDALFTNYLASEITVSNEFISNVNNKELSFNLQDEKFYKTSFTTHYQRIFAKYNYPLNLSSDLLRTESLIQWLYQNDIDFT